MGSEVTLLHAIVDARIDEQNAREAKFIGSMSSILSDLKEAGYTGSVMVHLAEGHPKAVEVVSRIPVKLR